MVPREVTYTVDSPKAKAQLAKVTGWLEVCPEPAFGGGKRLAQLEHTLNEHTPDIGPENACADGQSAIGYLSLHLKDEQGRQFLAPEVASIVSMIRTMTG